MKYFILLVLFLIGCQTTGEVVSEPESRQAADDYLLGIVDEYDGVDPDLVKVERGDCASCYVYIYEFEARGFDPGVYQVTVPVNDGSIGTSTIIKMTSI